MPTSAIVRGTFERPESDFRDLVPAGASRGRYHLYVSPACPWSHRAIIARRLLGLEAVVGMSCVDPIRDQRGWAFTGEEFSDPINGFRFLAEAYVQSDPEFAGRVSVPVLWDLEDRRILNNESADILRMFNDRFDARDDVDLYPADLREEIDAVNERIYASVNNGVYRAGFARSQLAYDQAFLELFDTLDWLEGRLGDQRYVVGSAQPTEADWRLFPTLVRFDTVYYLHFKCNRRRIVDYPNLWAYTRELYQHPGVAETLAMDQIKRHYYITHGSINPTRIVPLGPDLDFGAPHGRA